MKNETEGCCKLSVITQHCSTAAALTCRSLSPWPRASLVSSCRSWSQARAASSESPAASPAWGETPSDLKKKQLFYFSRWLWPWHEAGAESYELRLVWGFYRKPKLISNTLKVCGRSQDLTFSLVAIMFLSECGHDFLIHDQNGKHSHTFSVRTKSDSLDLLSHSDVQYPTTTRWWHKNQT